MRKERRERVPKEKVPCKCLSRIMLDSVIESDEKYYPQRFLEERKYVQEKIKFENYIDEDYIVALITIMNKSKIF